MRTRYIQCVMILAGLLAGVCPVAAQQSGGFEPGFQPGVMKQGDHATQFRPVVAAVDEMTSVYSTTLYTFDEIIVFAFFDDTEVFILDSEADTVAAGVLNRNGMLTYDAPAAGVFNIHGSKSFSAMMGDMLSNSVQGYFAVDQGGSGTSTLLNTYMMRYGWGPEKFIVFSYEDNTRFTITNLQSGEVLHTGFLNQDEFFTLPQTPYQTYLQVSASNPVSALSYADTDYYVPSSTGLFSGTEFLGYSGYIGNWTNSITVVGYHDDTDVVITNLETGEVIDSYILQESEVRSEPITSEVYWKVETSQDVTVANIPFVNWTGNYSYLATVSDRDGMRAGRFFYVPTIGGQLDIFSFADDNEIELTLLGSDGSYPYEAPELLLRDTLESGESVRYNVPSGRYIYKVEGTENLAILQSYGGYGADFMPLRHGLELPNLTVSSRDISFSRSPSEAQPGDEIDILANIANQGVRDAYNVLVHFYSTPIDDDGDDADDENLGKFNTLQNVSNLKPIATARIAEIPAKESRPANFSFLVPRNAEYRNYSIVIDPENTVTQSNVSNNTISFPLIENQDLNPPVAAHVTARSRLPIDRDDFNVKLTLFNIAGYSLEGLRVELHLMDGLVLNEGDPVYEFTQFNPTVTANMEWTFGADHDLSGYNRYEIHLAHDSLDNRVIKRSINVEAAGPPAVPEGFIVEAGDGEGKVKLHWTESQELDLEGYILHYGTASGLYDGIGSSRGDSPIYISAYSGLDLSGLEPGETYYFALQSVNTFGYSSDMSDESTVMVPVSVEMIASDRPESFGLFQNYPNPFNPMTVIRYDLPESAEVRLEVYDLLGRRIAVLVSEQQQPGSYSVTFDGQDLSSGLYLYRIQAGPYVKSSQMMLLK